MGDSPFGWQADGTLRPRLSDDKLDWLMRAALLGPNIKDFDPKPIIQEWLQDSKRGRQLNKLEWHLNKLLDFLEQ